VGCACAAVGAAAALIVIVSEAIGSSKWPMQHSSKHKQHPNSLSWFKSLLRDPVFQQLAPLLVLVLFPLVFFFCATRLRWLIYRTMTFVDSLGLSWLWSSSSSHDPDPSRRHAGRRKHPRTRAEQLEMAHLKASGSSTHKPGM
jgi:hypothetical protein